jgi:peptide deformylase
MLYLRGLLAKTSALIHPIVAYGDPVLKKRAKEIESSSEELKALILDMFETMYEASGVGLAAPQIGKSIRLFVVDASPFAEDEEMDEEERTFLADFKRVFINATIEEEYGEEWDFEEGCLSIPDIREKVTRESELKIVYQDENFEPKEEILTGLAARVIQHEYDHIEGVLFTDRLNPLRRRLLKGRLSDISSGKVKAKYRMRFPKKK